MSAPILQNAELNTFKLSNALLKDPYKPGISKSFEEVLNDEVKEVIVKEEKKVIETTTDKKKKSKQNQNESLPDISKIIPNGKNDSASTRNTYLLLEKFKSDKKYLEEAPKGLREQVLMNATNAAGQPLIQPIYDQMPRRGMTKSHMLELWEKMAPTVTEDPMKKAVRLDIPLLNDVQALVLRIHPDRSISASLLGSKEMLDLVKLNKDRLDRNLRHHNLSLRELNGYISELDLSRESGTRKQRKNKSKTKKSEVDLI